MIKIERSPNPPASLAREAQKSNGSGCYNGPDVMQALNKDFFGKCYICELKPLQDPVVEHLLPHHNGNCPERKFAWDNLFLSCHHCNDIKNCAKYEDQILDCCKVDPEQVIQFSYLDGEVFVRPLKEDDVKAARTAELVEGVFNKTNTGIRILASQERLRALKVEMDNLYKIMLTFKKTHDPLSRIKLKAALSRETAFAAFKRNAVRESGELGQEFCEILQ